MRYANSFSSRSSSGSGRVHTSAGSTNGFFVYIWWQCKRVHDVSCGDACKIEGGFPALVVVGGGKPAFIIVVVGKVGQLLE
jgi:hypothetical protein